MDNRTLIYDKLNNEPLIPKKTYPLNKTNVEKYIAEFDDEFKPIIQKIFDKTTHISYKKFKFLLNSNFKEFINYCNVNKIKNVYLFFDITDLHLLHKSNFWIAQHFIQYITKYKIDLNIIIIYDKTEFSVIKNDDIILILDDCTYDGELIRYYMNKNFSRIKTKLNIYILISFISENAKDLIKSVSSIHKFIFLKNNFIIYPLEHYLNDEEKRIISISGYPILLRFEINNYPIYFDHNLAEYEATFKAIYSGYIPWTEKIIPVMTNCEHIQHFDFYHEDDSDDYEDYNLDDYDNNKCPPKPYKINKNADELFRNYSIGSNDYRELKKNSLSLGRKKIKKPFRSVKSNLFNPDKLQKFILLKKPLLIPIRSYPIIKLKLKDYIDLYRQYIREDEEQIILKLLDKIYYFSYDTFKKTLFKCFDNVIKYYYENKLRKLTIIINNEKVYSSSYWVTRHFIQYLIENVIDDINIDFVNDFNIKKTKETYIYFDDCIYDDFNIKSINTNNTILIVCPYISYEMYLKLTSISNCKIFHIVKLLKIRSFLTEIEQNKLRLSPIFNQILDLILVYFDHSINIFNTFYKSFIVSLIDTNNIPCPYNELDVKQHNNFKIYVPTNNRVIVKKSKYLTFNDCMKMGSTDPEDECIDIYKNENLDIIMEELKINNIHSFNLIIETLRKHKTLVFSRLRNLLLDDKIRYYRDIIEKLEGYDKILYEFSIEKLKELIELTILFKKGDDFFEGGYKLKRTDIKIKFHFNNNNYTRCILIDNKNKKYVKINGKIVDLQKIK